MSARRTHDPMHTEEGPVQRGPSAGTVYAPRTARHTPSKAPRPHTVHCAARVHWLVVIARSNPRVHVV
eukprot:5897629-Prymnesium_polylepis.2